MKNMGGGGRGEGFEGTALYLCVWGGGGEGGCCLFVFFVFNSVGGWLL